MTLDLTIRGDILTEASDAELVRAAQEGDKAAFADLYRRYLDRIYRYFYARTGDGQRAEDLTAQTFVAALEALHRYRERGYFSAWLFTIAARRYADHCREPRPASLDRDPPVCADPVDPLPLPERMVAHAERDAALVEALQTLTPGRAQAIGLHFFGGLTYKETARAMNRSRVAVKSLIHRGLQDLRERLADEVT